MEPRTRSETQEGLENDYIIGHRGSDVIRDGAMRGLKENSNNTLILPVNNWGYFVI